jgi:hypothetical protein
MSATNEKPKVPGYISPDNGQGMGVPARCHCKGELRLKRLGWTCESCGCCYGRED